MKYLLLIALALFSLQFSNKALASSFECFQDDDMPDRFEIKATDGEIAVVFTDYEGESQLVYRGNYTYGSGSNSFYLGDFTIRVNKNGSSSALYQRSGRRNSLLTDYLTCYESKDGNLDKWIRDSLY